MQSQAKLCQVRFAELSNPIEPDLTEARIGFNWAKLEGLAKHSNFVTNSHIFDLIVFDTIRFCFFSH